MMIWLPIENVWDAEICKRTVRQLYAILEMHHGFDGAHDIWHSEDGARRSYDWDAYEKKLARISPIKRYDDHEKARLALEYYSMPKPRKKTLARVLARANKHLPLRDRYGTNGATSELVMLKQLDRALKETKGLGIEKLRPDELREALQWHANACKLEKAARFGTSPFYRALRRSQDANRHYRKIVDGQRRG
jgi:hypothetical protein